MKGDTRTCARFPSSLARPPLPSVRQSSPSGARSGSFFVPAENLFQSKPLPGTPARSVL